MVGELIKKRITKVEMCKTYAPWYQKPSLDIRELLNKAQKKNLEDNQEKIIHSF